MVGPVISDVYRLVSLDSVDSTNQEIKRRAGQGAVEGTLVWAREQTAGRGRRGRAWTSPPGNLYCSLLLRPGYAAAKALQVGFVTAVAVGDAVAAMLPDDAVVTCKWPNDVLVGGRKIAGILIESSSAGMGSLDWLAIGVGINVALHPTGGEGQYPATSLAAEGSAAGVGVEAVLQAYGGSLQRCMTLWHDHGFAAIRAAWLQRAHGLGRPITVRLEGESLHGVFADLDENGALVLSRDGRRRLITFGDVFPASAAANA